MDDEEVEAIMRAGNAALLEDLSSVIDTEGNLRRIKNDGRERAEDRPLTPEDLALLELLAQWKFRSASSLLRESHSRRAKDVILSLSALFGDEGRKLGSGSTHVVIDAALQHAVEELLRGPGA